MERLKKIFFRRSVVKYGSFTNITISQKHKGSDERAVKCEKKRHNVYIKIKTS